MKVYISNAFSLQMLPLEAAANVKVVPVCAEDIMLAQEIISAVGHADTAAVLSNMLGISIPCQRINVRLTTDDVLYVAQVVGGRLPEGCTTLPEGVEIRFFRVTYTEERHYVAE